MRNAVEVLEKVVSGTVLPAVMHDPSMGASVLMPSFLIEHLRCSPISDVLHQAISATLSMTGSVWMEVVASSEIVS